MKKILIIYTGGTIGMDYSDNGLQVVPGLFKSQLQQLAPVANVHIDLIEYENLIDSSEIKITHWIQMIDQIKRAYTSYDGFVIIHGTDTMAYTASVLAFALKGLSKPVVLTGAQLPLVHRRSDGWSNLIDALYAAGQEDLHEVVISFDHKLLRGCRARKVSTDKFIGFDSMGKTPLAEFGINVSWYKDQWMQARQTEFLPIVLKPVKILVISLYPGYTTDFVAECLATVQVKGLVLRTYGCGNIPLQHPQLAKSIQKASERGIIIINVTQVTEGCIASNYTNGKVEGLGMVSGSDMTTEAALAKLTVLLSTDMSDTAIRAAIGYNLAGELTQK
ncbi:MAG: asparaginase [Burkholderiales bacterium]|jgi:L-asparaginase|nr:asparaginase [Burkholderiales bacterium]